MFDREVWSLPPRDVAPGSRRLWPRVVAVAAVLLVATGAAAAYLLTRATETSTTGTSASRDLGDPDADPGQRILEAAGGVGPEPLVDPTQIQSGGPPPDGIPPIDDPRFLNATEVSWLAPKEPVIVVAIEGHARAYPLQIMTWHEIVNDTVAGTPVTVTFCPLCNTAYAFVRPEVEGEVTTFGTSGMLYHSNLVMYDRATTSLWPQALGQAVIGPLTGTRLDRVPSQIVSWSEFQAAFPEGVVLSRDTGFERRYGENPYPGYDDVDKPPFLFKGKVDGRLAAVERILGVEGTREVVAFAYRALRAESRGGTTAVNTAIGGEAVVVMWRQGTVSALDAAAIASSKDVGAAAAFSRRVDNRVLDFVVRSGSIVDRETGTAWNLLGRGTNGELAGKQLEPVDAHDSFWFDWAAFHPNSRVWGNE